MTRCLVLSMAQVTAVRPIPSAMAVISKSISRIWHSVPKPAAPKNSEVNSNTVRSRARKTRNCCRNISTHMNSRPCSGSSPWAYSFSITTMPVGCSAAATNSIGAVTRVNRWSVMVAIANRKMAKPTPSVSSTRVAEDRWSHCKPMMMAMPASTRMPPRYASTRARMPVERSAAAGFPSVFRTWEMSSAPRS